MRAFILAAVFAALLGCTSPKTQTEPAPAPTAQSKYSTAATDIGTLLDDPAARAVIDKHMPGFSTGERVSMARGMTLKGIQPFAPAITDQVLANVDADLVKLPAKK